MFGLRLDDISDEERVLSWREEQEMLASYLKSFPHIDFAFEMPLEATAKIRRSGQSFLIQGQVRTTLKVRCGRCLKEFPYPVSSRFDLTLHPLEGTAFEEEVVLTEEDMASHFFEGGELHLSEIACEQVFLEIPPQPLCDPECKGLCPVCGKDLNISSCACRQEPLESGFSALKKLKLN